MIEQGPQRPKKDLWRGFYLHLSLVVTLFVLGVFLGVFYRNESLLNQAVLSKAQAAFQTMLLARRWNAGFAGVYVEKTPGVQSNPYLTNPDVACGDGRVFTKRNPAFMVREISELDPAGSSVRFHMVSLKPQNPKNSPDAREAAALARLEGGQGEVHWKETLGSATWFRYLAPLKVEKPCLACHDKQGYQLGDVIGGITVSFDVTDVEEALAGHRLVIWGLALVTGLNMLGLVMFLVQRLKKRVSQLQAELEQLSVTDPLTGLANRRFLMAALEQETARARRYDGRLSLLMLDLDHFKQVNDTHGHGVGDLVLIQVAQAIRGFCRVSDVVARYGGEELAVLAPHTDLAQAMTMAEKLRVMVESLPLDGGSGRTLAVTVSIGVARFRPGDRDPAQDASHLLSGADTALYRAKAKGRNRVEGPAAEEGA